MSDSDRTGVIAVTDYARLRTSVLSMSDEEFHEVGLVGITPRQMRILACRLAGDRKAAANGKADLAERRDRPTRAELEVIWLRLAAALSVDWVETPELAV